MKRPATVILCLLAAAAVAAAPPGACVRVRTLYPTGQVRIWTSDDGQDWQYVIDSRAFATAAAGGAAHGDYLFALPYLPAYVRVGVTGAFLGRLSVDAISGLVGTAVREPLAWQAVGTVVSPQNARVADDRAAVIVHRGQADVVSGFVLRFTPSEPPPPPPPPPTPKWGVYTGPHDASDTRVEAMAWWDFTVFQQGAGLQECVRRVKEVNPDHRIVLRLVLPARGFLLYAYDPDSRRDFRRQIVDAQFGAVADLVDTVTLSEEEPGNTFKGIYDAVIPPREVYLWKDRYTAERGKPFVWPPTPDVNDWLGEKFTDMLNDLYDYVHQCYPHIKVYQWVELAGYGNRSGFYPYVHGENLKMDGYVLEWSEATFDDLVETPLGPAAVRRSYFERYLDNLRATNHLGPDEILAQVWAYNPEQQDTFAQIEAVRRLGMHWVYFFFPAAAAPPAWSLYHDDGSPPWAYAHQVWDRFQPMVEARRRQ